MPTEKLIRKNGAFVLYYGLTSDQSTTTVVSASFQSTPTYLVVAFDASKSIGGSTYAWNFGDGATTTTASTTTNHTYSSAGTRTVTLTVTAADGSSDTATQSVTVAAQPVSGGAFTQDDGNGGTLGSPGSGTQRTGTGFVAYNSTGSNLDTQANAVGSTNKLSLPVGTFQKLKAWTPGSTGVLHGADITGGGGIIGAGSSKSILSQVPNASTGPYVSGTSRDELMRITANNVTLQDFQLLGVAQSTVPTWHGIDIVGSGVSVIRVKMVQASHGNDKAPPGETFGLSFYNTNNLGTLDDIEIDGQGFGASGFGTNGSGGISNAAGSIGDYTVNRLYTHNNYYSGGIALWQQNGIATFNDCTFDMCRCFWNIERCAGKVIINRPRIGTLHAATTGWAGTSATNPNGNVATPIGIFCEADSYVGATLATAFRFEVHDPRNLDGTPYTGGRITVNFGSANDKGTQYYGRTQFKAYSATGADISSTFYSYGGVPAN